MLFFTQDLTFCQNCVFVARGPKFLIFFYFLPTETYAAIFSWWIIYSFPVIFIYKSLNFWYPLWMFSNFLMTQCDCCSVLKAFIIIIDRIFCCFFVFMQSGESTVDLQYLELVRDRKKSSTYQEFDLSRVWKKKHSKNELRAIFLWFNDTRFYIWLIYDKVTILNSFLKCFFASFTAFWLLWKRFHILILGYACPDYAWSCRVQLLEWS